MIVHFIFGIVMFIVGYDIFSSLDKRYCDIKLNKKIKIIVIDKKPDNEVINKLLELPYCSYDRQYVADNLYHDVFTLYY